MYKERTIQNAVARANDTFPAVLLNGPRQVGKTTVFKNCAGKFGKRAYVSLDSLENRTLAQNDPKLFLERFSPPVLIDEIQYAPQLFPYIKADVDARDTPGLYWLTGSQQFHLMKNVSESLAGRIAILKLQGFSQREKFGNPAGACFIPTTDFLKNAGTDAPALKLNELYDLIWHGSFPKLSADKKTDWSLFYSSYVDTYVQRDIRALTAITNESSFLKFMRAVAARTGQLLNYADLARDADISQPTAKAWLSVLQTSGLVYLLEPYHTNLTTRLSKMSKLYFLDTGLACWLTGWNSARTLELGAASGAFFETYVISEILKSYWHNAKRESLFFYRDKEQNEIDLLIEANGVLHPVEIKKKSNPGKDDIRSFDCLKNLSVKVGNGAVICLAETHLPITESVSTVPVSYL